MELLNKITIRQVMPDDYRTIEELTREAFWDLFRPGCDEHLMVHQLHKSAAYIKELDLAACEDGRIVGHILYTHSYVVDDNNQKHEVISFGPISVLPDYQNQGIGSALIRHSVASAKSMGFKGIFIYGNPKYYNRFGFRNAERFKICTPDGDNFDDFMGLELYDDALCGITGRLYEDSAFGIDKDVLEAFDNTFPYREKRHGR